LALITCCILHSTFLIHLWLTDHDHNHTWHSLPITHTTSTPHTLKSSHYTARAMSDAVYYEEQADYRLTTMSACFILLKCGVTGWIIVLRGLPQPGQARPGQARPSPGQGQPALGQLGRHQPAGPACLEVHLGFALRFPLFQFYTPRS